MEYRKIGEAYYIRMDRGDEIISTLLELCEKETISSAVFSGIGGCQSAELQVFIPETGSFETERLEGMLELVSLNGNVVRDDNIPPYPCSIFIQKARSAWYGRGTSESYNGSLYSRDRVTSYDWWDYR